MNYSAINHAIYRIGLGKSQFVIGGTFAAGLSEPRLARAMGNAGNVANLFVSSTNFEILKGYGSSNPAVSTAVGENKITIRDGSLTINFHRGIPQYWVNDNGYKVQNPLPLKQWLINNDLETWGEFLQDAPFEKRLEGLTLNEEEEAFKEVCASHDWYSDYSDSATVVANGQQSYAALINQRDKIGGHAKVIFDYYSSK